MSTQNKIGNPAVVGLAAFGLTTILLQFHSLGLISKGPVLAMGLVFGGLAQFIAGLQEQKVGNNFGYSAFTSYGAFWMGLGIVWVLNALGVYTATHQDVGWFLVAWTGYTAIMWVASMRVHKAMFITFSLLLLGFILLDVGHLLHLPIVDRIAAFELIVCALAAWYMMAAAIINDLAGRAVLPLGQALLKKAVPAPSLAAYTNGDEKAETPKASAERIHVRT